MYQITQAYKRLLTDEQRAKLYSWRWMKRLTNFSMNTGFSVSRLEDASKIIAGYGVG